MSQPFQTSIDRYIDTFKILTVFHISKSTHRHKGGWIYHDRKNTQRTTPPPISSGYVEQSHQIGDHTLAGLHHPTAAPRPSAVPSYSSSPAHELAISTTVVAFPESQHWLSLCVGFSGSPLQRRLSTGVTATHTNELWQKAAGDQNKEWGLMGR